jgi:hypothetical protein
VLQEAFGIMIALRLLLLTFVILCAISAVLCQYDISTRLEPKGKLKVRLDYGLALNWPEEHAADEDPQLPWTWFFSSHLTFKESVDDIPAEKLWQMAVDGYYEAIDEWAWYGISKLGAMTVLAWDKQIILASSMKGMMSFSYALLDTPVSKTLELCETIWKEAGNPEKKWKHNNQGKCGELMAAQIYYSIGGSALGQQKHRVGTVTWNIQQNKPIPAAPCGDPAKVSESQLLLDLPYAGSRGLKSDMFAHRKPGGAT